MLGPAVMVAVVEPMRERNLVAMSKREENGKVCDRSGGVGGAVFLRISSTGWYASYFFFSMGILN